MTQAKSQPKPARKDRGEKRKMGITAIRAEGYKAIHKESRIDIAPLTILAGANSSGKSSIMQPLLLMKQTLEAGYDPGPLLLDGPNLQLTSTEQLFSSIPLRKRSNQFKTSIEIDQKSITCCFRKGLEQPIDLESMEYVGQEGKIKLADGMHNDDLIEFLPLDFQESVILLEQINMKAIRDRCLFWVEIAITTPYGRLGGGVIEPAKNFKSCIQEVVHVPGLRGSPERTYKTTAVSDLFPGTFDNYIASVVNYWQAKNDGRIELLSKNLRHLGLTSKIESKEIKDTQVEIRVDSLPCLNSTSKTRGDMVSIADVGFGVSQVLPVLVSLLTADLGQLVYIEQPEIHLHPRAQVALAEVFAEAVERGVRVVVETHSELFLQGIQSLVAEGKLSPDDVKLHWFTRQEDGATKISSAELDQTGAFGNWPEDFSEVSLATQNRYLTAAEAKLWQE